MVPKEAYELLKCACVIFDWRLLIPLLGGAIRQLQLDVQRAVGGVTDALNQASQARDQGSSRENLRYGALHIGSLHQAAGVPPAVTGGKSRSAGIFCSRARTLNLRLELPALITSRRPASSMLNVVPLLISYAKTLRETLFLVRWEPTIEMLEAYKVFPMAWGGPCVQCTTTGLPMCSGSADIASPHQPCKAL